MSGQVVPPRFISRLVTRTKKKATQIQRTSMSMGKKKEMGTDTLMHEFVCNIVE